MFRQIVKTRKTFAYGLGGKRKDYSVRAKFNLDKAVCIMLRDRTKDDQDKTSGVLRLLA